MFKKYSAVFHSEKDSKKYLFYTTRSGVTSQMSADNVARFLNTYEKAAKAQNPGMPHLHPHLFRHVSTLKSLEKLYRHRFIPATGWLILRETVAQY